MNLAEERMQIRHPVTGLLYERLDDGTVQVSDAYHLYAQTMGFELPA